jgi:radical S-adenosyl methionine domain-containing protein 2
MSSRSISDGSSLVPGRSAAALPSTVNLHLVAHCNMDCKYCYAPFLEERKRSALGLDEVIVVLRQLAANGVRRVTFAGGEPTLNPRLAEMLRAASRFGLVTSIVTNASLITRDWLTEHGAYIRWLTLSIDSVLPSTVVTLGRRPRGKGPEHLTQVLHTSALVHRFNRSRPFDRRIRLKMNVTVTKLNAGEDPTIFIRACQPEKVKVLQMLLVEGENDRAADLVCSPEDFDRYVARMKSLDDVGIAVVTEGNDDMDGSYAMIDPMGRFYQRVDGRYVRSRPIVEVGVMNAWHEVGGFDAGRFVARGGEYEPGAPASGNHPYWIAVEGLDGSGKSTIAARLAERLDATLIHNPPQTLAAARGLADALSDEGRRAWYRHANMEAIRQAEAVLVAGRPVVMDRSLATTLAFAAAERGKVASARDWPVEAPRPDLLLVLSVPEEERRRRLEARARPLTAEEARLASDETFRLRILSGYAALGAWAIPAGGTTDNVLESILALLRAGT